MRLLANFQATLESNLHPEDEGRKMKVRGFAIALSALLMAASVPGMADAAGKGGPGTGARSSGTGPRGGTGHHHRHRVGPRVGVGIGIGLGLGYGGFYDPFFDPYYDYGYPAYGYPAYGYAPQPVVPCTPADVPKTPPTNNQFSPDFAYDRIDAARCTPEAVAEAQAAAAAQAGAAQPQAPGAQPAPAYYFCRSANAYYPNVKECTEGWQPVAPRPPGS
jgi:hypothetical protein